jgi:hypothetical protein
MFSPLASAAKAFEATRATYIAAVAAGDADAAHEALADAVAIADNILTFLGYIEPYACGECDACQHNAEAVEEEQVFRALLATLDFDEAAGQDEAGK